MRAVMQPTHQALNDISAWLMTLDTKVGEQDSQLKEEIESIQFDLKAVAYSNNYKQS